MNPTRVISVRGLRPDEFLADPEAVYVGRALPRLGWKGSAWGNPFRVGMTAGDVLRLFDVIPEADRRRDAIVVLDPPSLSDSEVAALHEAGDIRFIERYEALFRKRTCRHEN